MEVFTHPVGIQGFAQMVETQIHSNYDVEIGDLTENNSQVGLLYGKHLQQRRVRYQRM